MGYRKVLLPVSGKHRLIRAARALVQALRLVQADGEICFLHCVNDAAHLLTVEANKKLVMEDTGEAEKLLNPLVERAKAAGVAYSIHLVEGAPEALIPGFASQKECDIVVMCTDNDKDSAKLAMGGLSGRVFQNLGVPLVLVH